VDVADVADVADVSFPFSRCNEVVNRSQRQPG